MQKQLTNDEKLNQVKQYLHFLLKEAGLTKTGIWIPHYQLTDDDSTGRKAGVSFLYAGNDPIKLTDPERDAAFHEIVDHKIISDGLTTEGGRKSRNSDVSIENPLTVASLFYPDGTPAELYAQATKQPDWARFEKYQANQKAAG